MSDFERLENIPINQRIDFPFIIYQSKPKLEKDRKYLINFDKVLILLLVILMIIGFFVLLTIGISGKNNSLIFLSWVIGAFALVFIGLYHKVLKNIAYANYLADLDLPKFFIFIELNKEHFKLYARDGKLKFDMSINNLKQLKIDSSKGIYNLHFYFDKYPKNANDFVMDLYDIDFYIVIDGKNYEINGVTIAYLVNYIRYHQQQNPTIDHVTLIKKHFINRYPMTAEWLES